MDPVRILVVDDQEDMREFLRDVLVERGYAVDAAADGPGALRALEGGGFHLVISDIRMPGMDGVALLDRIKAQSGFTPFVILITAFGDVDDTVRLLDRGAYDYVIKPFKLEQLLVAVRRAERELGLRRRVEELEGRTSAVRSFHGLLGKSLTMERIFATIEKVAPAEGSVLIEGETGTGKELVARALHRASPRAGGPFVAINCASIPEGLLESELFGHVRGAFTGAEGDKEGLFVAAERGTLFLDEIGELPPGLQAKLLRAIQEREVRPVGSNRQIPFDVRIVAATNRNLLDDARQGRFREDIYYRLSTFRLRVPPLRERREDIPLLVEELALGHGSRGRDVTFSPEVLRAFLDYGWPGNVRELENVIERCLYVCEEGVVRLGDLPEEVLQGLRPREEFCWPGIRPLEEVERDYIRYVLDRCGGNKVQAAQLLGVNRKTIQRKLSGES
ncbi:MAG: sigma-54 dependent transcriptional regulator [Thermodesulfobacteriota bacterium]